MKLVFSVKPDESLEIRMARLRYKDYWNAHEANITDAYHRHTGLKFKQKIITVHIWDEYKSRAGMRGVPMQLTRHIADEEDLAGVLIHELAHRLLMGWGIEPTDNVRNHVYLYHKHINLFLYDVFKDVCGEKVAKDQVAIDSRNGNGYKTAWKWALDKTYEERQKSLKALIARYK